ncbi:MAG: sulfurtransferase [Polyangiaceae bacterium]
MFPLVSTDWVHARLAEKKAELRVIDVRWYLSGKRGADAYTSGHLPGAAFVDLDHALASDPKIGPGRHPLPAREVFENAMRAAGVNDTSFLVAYDDASGSIAARVWWLLRHFGHSESAVLDGGIDAWKKAGFEITTSPAQITPGDFHAKEARSDVVDREEVKRALARGALVLDARARERYRGDAEPIDARPGHVPGAVCAPWKENLEGGAFACAGDLAKKYEALGASQGREIIAYCGSGVTACHDLLALELAGIHGAKLYEGSWSDWARQADLPAAKGSDPGKL